MSDPAAIRKAFDARLLTALAAKGFNALKGQKFVRKVGKNRHRIALDSSLPNDRNEVRIRVTPFFEDGNVRKTEKGWFAGGSLPKDARTEDSEPAFDIANEAEAARLIASVIRALDFFELFEAPERLFEEVTRRYVPGLVAPIMIAPYLRTHLGEDAVLSYVEWMLAARPELWPAFVAKAPVEPHIDHGTQLGALATLDAPSGTVTSTDRRARFLRSFFGLELRAWGEPAAAARLRTIPDAEVRRLHDAHEELRRALLHGQEGDIERYRLASARCTLAMVGEAREPAYAKPVPFYFQYCELHPPFARQ